MRGLFPSRKICRCANCASKAQIITSASLLSAFDNKETELAREYRAELRDLASSRFAKHNEEIRKDILTLIKQSDIFLPDTKLAKNFNIEDEPSLQLASNFKHY